MPPVTMPQEIGEGRVWITASKSRPGALHVTILTSELDGANKISCTCEGMRYLRRCWHADHVRRLTGEQEEEDFEVNL